MATLDVNAMAQQVFLAQANTNPQDSVAQAKRMQQAIVAHTANVSNAVGNVAQAEATAADNADMLRTEAAALGNQSAVNVLSIYEQVRTQTAGGMAQARAKYAEAIEERTKSDTLAAEAPSLFKNPLAAITMRWQSAQSDVRAKEAMRSAQETTVNVNSLISMGRTEMQNELNANTLNNTAILQTRAAELSEGIRTQNINAEAQLKQAELLAQGSEKLYKVSTDAVSVYLQTWQLTSADKDRVLRQKAYNLELDKLRRDVDKAKKLDASLWRIQTALAFAANPKGNPSQADIAAQYSQANNLISNAPEVAGRLEVVGNSYQKYSDRALAEKDWMAKSSIATVQTMGHYADNTRLKGFGAEMVNAQVSAELDRELKRRYTELTKQDPAANPTAYARWTTDLGAGEKKAIEQVATQNAQNAVGSMSTEAYLQAKAAKRPLSNTGISLDALKDPNKIQRLYGYKVGSTENAALNNPTFRTIFETAQVTGKDNATAHGAAAALEWLTQAGVKNPQLVLTQLYKAAHKGAIRDNDSEYDMAAQAGVDITPQAWLRYDGGRYNMADPVDVHRLALRKKNPPKAWSQYITDPLNAVGSTLGIGAANMVESENARFNSSVVESINARKLESGDMSMPFNRAGVEQVESLYNTAAKFQAAIEAGKATQAASKSQAKPKPKSQAKTAQQLAPSTRTSTPRTTVGRNEVPTDAQAMEQVQNARTEAVLEAEAETFAPQQLFNSKPELRGLYD